MKVMVTASVVGFLLCSSGCERPSYTTDAESYAQTALFRVGELQSKVQSLESDKRDLESKLSALESRVDANDRFDDYIVEKHNAVSTSFWEYQRENEKRFGRVGQQWTLIK